MKKIITCMIFGLLSLISCTEYDEIAIWNKSEYIDSRLAALEELCSRMNTNITSLQLIVEALQGNDYVTGVTPVVENGKTIGYTITFIKSGPVTIYHGKDGQQGTAPVIGIKQDGGIYYWTFDGEWLTDDRGDRVMAQGMAGKSAYELAVEKGYRGTLEAWLASLNGINGNDGKSAYELAVENGYRGTEEEWLESLKGDNGNKGDNGITPKLEIREDGYWYISYDGGQMWTKLDRATGDPGQNGDSMFSDVDNSDPDYLVLTLSENGEQIKLPYYKDKFDLLFVSGTDKVKEMTVYCSAGTTAVVNYELTNPLNVQISIACISHSGYKVTVDKTGKKISVSAPDDPAAISEPESGILVFASDDERTIMRKLVVKQMKYIEYTAHQQLGWNNGAYGPRFGGKNCTFLDEQCTYDKNTKEGKWAYTGTVERVNDGAFLYEDQIISIVLPSGIEIIEGVAFQQSSIETIELPNTLKSIGNTCFGYSKLTRITIPKSVVSLDRAVFSKCAELISADIQANIEELPSNTFEQCSKLQNIKLPESLKRISNNTFINCSLLEEITIPDAVTVIDDKAFSQCSSLKKVILGTQLERIGTNAFNRCSALETILCPDETPATLGKGAFPVADGWTVTNASYRIYVPDEQLETYRQAWPDYWAAPNNFQITKVIYGISSMPTQ